MSGLDVMALDYAVGALSGEAYRDARERSRRDAAFAAEVAAVEAMLGPLAEALAPMPLPDRLLARIEAEIDAPMAAEEAAITVRADEGRWLPYRPGIDIKLLWQSPELGRQSLLMRIAPGALYEAHDHDDDEECYVLEGDVSFGPLTLRAGDYHVALRGGAHPTGSSQHGALLLLTTGLPHAGAEG
jgi:anti-sigma factor ChrR (cupin superfamily)